MWECAGCDTSAKDDEGRDGGSRGVCEIGVQELVQHFTAHTTTDHVQVPKHHQG